MKHISVHKIVIVILFLIIAIVNIACKIYKDNSTHTIDCKEENKIVLIENDKIKEYSFETFGIIYFANKEIYNTTNLKTKLHNLNNLRQRTKCAKIEKTSSEFIVVDAIQGNYIDIEKLYEYIIDNIDNHYIEVDLTLFYEYESITGPTYEELSSVVSTVNNTSIKYTNGYEIKINQFIDYLVLKNNVIKIDESKEDELYSTIDDTIEQELIEYDTYGKEREFTTASGNTILISGGTYGNIFNSDKETEYIIDKFKNFESEEGRVPIYKKEFPEEIGNTYIEVSIDEQHLWYYDNGELKLESDVVTGTKNKNDTPVGVYYISEKIAGKYLTGDTYKTWVNQWLRITNRGHGLHDAYWRSSFGGNIYTYNGSHGCINLPKSKAKELFSLVGVNTVVVIY